MPQPSRRSQLRQLAQDRAHVLKSRQSPLLSESEQLKTYDQRVSEGGQFFKGLIDEGRLNDVARYVRAMEKLKKERGA